MVRVTRNEAAARLKVSKSTLDRMIKRGDLATEEEQHGLRHTVWVLMDDVVEDTNENTTGNTNGHLPASSEHIGGDTGAENLALQAEVKGLRELVDLYRERLTDADWRYQGGRKDQPGIGHQAAVVEGDLDAVEVVAW